MASYNHARDHNIKLEREDKEQQEKEFLKKYDAEIVIIDNPYSQGSKTLSVYRVNRSKDGLNTNESLIKKAKALEKELKDREGTYYGYTHTPIVNKTDRKIMYIDLDDYYDTQHGGGKRRKTLHKKSLKRKNKKTKSNRK